MATNSVTWTGSYGQYSRLYIEFNLVSQHTTNNTSTFAYKVRGQSTTSGASITWVSGSLQLSNAYSKTKAIGSGSFNYSTEFVFDSGTFTVSHNADGTLSARTLTAYVTLTSGNNATVSVSLSVPDIKRASQPRLNISTQNLGSAITIYTDRASTSFTHKMSYAFGTLSGTIKNSTDGTDIIGDSTVWTLPNDLANAIPNATSGWGTIVCKTYNGATLIGTKGITFTATVPNNETFQPSASIYSVVEGDEDIIASLFTVFIQSKSKFKVTSGGSGKFGAGISSYRVTVEGAPYVGQIITTDFIKGSGDIKVTLVVTDTRSYQTSVSVTRNVVEYFAPRLTEFSGNRYPTDTDADLQTSFNFEIAPISNQNGSQYRIRYRTIGGAWVTPSLIDVIGTYSLSTTRTFAGILDVNTSYEVEFYVKDYFTEITRTINIGTGFTLMHWNPSGRHIAFGKVSEGRELLEVFGNLLIQGLGLDTKLLIEQLQGNAGIEVGNPTVFGKAYVDFLTSGNGNDYDVRIIADGGTASNGRGVLGIQASDVLINDISIMGSKANRQQGAWISPTLQSGWVNFGAPHATCQYMKDEFGFVHLKGLVKDGTFGLHGIIFTLPTGYRPDGQLHFSTVSNDAFGKVDIRADGSVVAQVGGNTMLSLSGIYFRAI